MSCFFFCVPQAFESPATTGISYLLAWRGKLVVYYYLKRVEGDEGCEAEGRVRLSFFRDNVSASKLELSLTQPYPAHLRATFNYSEVAVVSRHYLPHHVRRRWEWNIVAFRVQREAWKGQFCFEE